MKTGIILTNLQACEAAETRVSVELANILQTAIKAASADINEVVTQINKNGAAIAQGVTLGYTAFYSGKSIFDGYRAKGGAKWCYFLSAGFNIASGIAHFLSINLKKQSAAIGFSFFAIGAGLRLAANYINQISHKKGTKIIFQVEEIID